MIRIRRGFSLVIREPYAPGHVCSAREAQDLNEAYATRIADGTRDWMAGRARTPSQEEVDARVSELCEKLDRATPRRTYTQGLRGLELEIVELAKETLERELKRRVQDLPTQAEREARLAILKQSERIVLAARARHEKKVAARRAALEGLFGLDEEGDGTNG